jgi:SAM-dependent methyltransferase
VADSPFDDQPQQWSLAAERYEQEFIDPDLPGLRNPVRPALLRLANAGCTTVADLGCGTGPLLPFLSTHFNTVYAVDFAEGMLSRARKRSHDHKNVRFFQQSLMDLTSLPHPIDVAVAVNSFVMPELDDLTRCLSEVHRILRPGGTFLGIVPSMDGSHYLTMLFLDRARQRGMPQAAARKNAALHAEHELFDLGFGEFRYRGLVQHFWHGFEVSYRLKQAGFDRVSVRKALLSWDQCACGKELKDFPPPWDWFFQATRSR